MGSFSIPRPYEISFTERELHTVLAALHVWKRAMAGEDAMVEKSEWLIAAPDWLAGGEPPLEGDEVTALCKRIEEGG